MNTAATIDSPTSSNRETPQPRLRLTAAPETLKRFEARQAEGPGSWIAYRDHPAYAALVAGASVGARALAIATFAKYFAVILCKRLICYELIPTHLRKRSSISGWCRFVWVAASHAFGKGVRRSATAAAGNDPISDALGSDGICVAGVTAAQLARLDSAAQQRFAQLRAARGTPDGHRHFDESRSYALRTAHADLFDAVESMLTETRILEGVSHYLGRTASLVDVNPQINDPSDDFWQRTFPDLPNTERPASYLHRDASGGDVKAIIYMSDVGPDNGPFSYVIGTQRVRSGSWVDWVEETNDQSGCSGTDAQQRARFAALPAPLRRKCAFGNDILPGTEIAERLRAGEWTITAPRGHVVIFDTKGFHRGGMVADGERLVLTCVIG